MEWTDEMIRQGARPTGELGRIVGLEMNGCHYELWKRGLSHVRIPAGARILDIGCGGGGAIKLMSTLCPDSEIYGIDISGDMVALTRETNETLVSKGKVKVQTGDVSAIPYPDCSFDMATAFETDYYWQDLLTAYKEVRRVLKPGGIFLIVDEAYSHELFKERNRYWMELTNGRTYAPEDYRYHLKEADFSSVEIFEDAERNWITALSRKPSSQ